MAETTRARLAECTSKPGGDTFGLENSGRSFSKLHGATHPRPRPSHGVLPAPPAPGPLSSSPPLILEEETLWEPGMGGDSWRTLVITPQVRGEGDEVTAGPGAGQGHRRAVGALGPFLPLADVSQVHCAHLPRSHTEDSHQLLQEGGLACHRCSRSTCRTPRAVLDTGLVRGTKWTQPLPHTWQGSCILLMRGQGGLPGGGVRDRGKQPEGRAFQVDGKASAKNQRLD